MGGESVTTLPPWPPHLHLGIATVTTICKKYYHLASKITEKDFVQINYSLLHQIFEVSDHKVKENHNLNGIKLLEVNNADILNNRIWDMIRYVNKILLFYYSL